MATSSDGDNSGAMEVAAEQALLGDGDVRSTAAVARHRKRQWDGGDSNGRSRNEQR